MANVVNAPAWSEKLFPGWHPVELSAAVLRRLFLAFALAYHPDKIQGADKSATTCFQQISDWYQKARAVAAVSGRVRIRWSPPTAENVLVPEPIEPEFVADTFSPKLVEIRQQRKFWRTGFSAYKEVHCAVHVAAAEVPFIRCMTAAHGNAFRLALHLRERGPDSALPPLESGPDSARELLQVHATLCLAQGKLNATGYFVWNHGGGRPLRATSLMWTPISGEFSPSEKKLTVSDSSTEVTLFDLRPEDPHRGALVFFMKQAQSCSFWRSNPATQVSGDSLKRKR